MCDAVIRFIEVKYIAGKAKPLQENVFCASCYCPLLGRTRSRGRCCADIPFSHRPKLSGRAVHGKVDRLDIVG